MLVVSTTHDPATPYQAGVDLAKELHGGLLTYEGTQHTVVFEGESCVDDAATKYLVDLTLPAAGHHVLIVSRSRSPRATRPCGGRRRTRP